MTTFSWTVWNAQVERALDNLIMLLSPQGLTVWLNANMGPYLSSRAKDRFASEGDDVTGPWAPLHPATIAIRESEGFGAGPINHRTGELEDWVVDGGWNAYPTGFGASMTFPKRVASGELKSKVETAQKGRDNPRTVPRPVLGVNEQDLLYFQTTLALSIEAAG